MPDMTHLRPQRRTLSHAAYALCTLLMAMNANAQETPTHHVTEWVPYELPQGQKFSQLLDRLTLPSNTALALQTLQEHNRPLDLNALQAGQTVRLPKNWIRQEPVPLKVTRIRCTGKAEPSTTAEQALYPGMSLGEGDIINVPGGCQVSLSLRDGSQLQLPSSSVVQIDTLRDSPDHKMPQVKLKLLQGKISLSLFKKRPAGATFEVATPRATTGVRGTEFRVSHDPGTELSAIEVWQGQVQTQAQDSQEREELAAQQGAVIGTQGHIQIEALPLPPQLAVQGQSWQWQDLRHTTQYVRQDLQAVNETPRWNLPQATPGGNIPMTPETSSTTRYVQAAAVNPSGLMGLTATFALCQSVAALPQPVCTVRFQIDEAGERATRLDLRERQANTVASWTPTRPHHSRTREVIALLPPGQYEWQMQAVRPDEAHTPAAERTTARGQFTLLSNASNPSPP
jgi:hypothetical protein